MPTSMFSHRRTTRKPPDRAKKKTRSHGQPMVSLPLHQWKAMQRILSQIPSILKNVRTNRELLLLILKQEILENKKLVLDKTYMLKNCNINNLQITSSGKNLMSFQASGQNEKNQFASDHEDSCGGFANTTPLIDGDNLVQMDDHDPSLTSMSDETAAASMLPVQAVTDGRLPACASDYDSGVSDCDSFVDDCSVASLSEVWSDADGSDDDAASVMEDSVIVSDVCDIDDGGQLGTDNTAGQTVSCNTLAPTTSALCNLVRTTSILINPHLHPFIGSVSSTGGCNNKGVKGMHNAATGPPVSGSSAGDSDLVSLNTIMPISALVTSPKVYEIICTQTIVLKKLTTFPGLFHDGCSGKYRMVVPANILRAGKVTVLKKLRAEVENVWQKANFTGFKPIYLLQFPVFLNTSRESPLDMYMYMYRYAMSTESQRVRYSSQSCTLAPSRSLTEGNVVDVVAGCSYEGDDEGSKRSLAAAKTRGRETADSGLQGEMKTDVDSASKPMVIPLACPDFRGLQDATGQMRRKTDSGKKAAGEKGGVSWLEASNKSRNLTASISKLPYTPDFSLPGKVPSIKKPKRVSNTCRIAAPINKPNQSVAECSIDGFGGASWSSTFGDIRLVILRHRDKNKKDKKVSCSTEVKDDVHETCGTEGCSQPENASHGEPTASAYPPDPTGQGDEKWQQIQNLSIDTEGTTVEKHAGQKSFPYFRWRRTGSGSKQRSAYSRACGKKTLRCKTDRSGHRIHKRYGIV